MKFTNIVYDMIVEEVKNKSLINSLLAKWQVENNSLTYQDVEGIYEKFAGRIQNGIRVDKPEILTFLNHFDGVHTKPKFPREPNLLKDITKYTYAQIVFLIDEYGLGEGNVEQIDRFRIGNDVEPNEEIVEASKELWGSDNNAVINEGGFRLYGVPDQATAIKYGYYEGEMARKIHRLFPQEYGFNQWCVTRFRINSNLWSNYRSRRYTFYFAIDDNRNFIKPTEEGEEPTTPKFEFAKYYLSAIIVLDSSASAFKIADLQNNNEYDISWEKLVQLFPALDGKRESFKWREYKEDEELVNPSDIRNKINEDRNSPYWFARMTKANKSAYIQNQGTLSDPDSWLSMDEDLRKLYIDTTAQNNLLDKFKSFAFVKTILSNPGNRKSLERRIGILGFENGLNVIIDNIMRNGFEPYHTSLDNPNLKIYESKSDSKIGIFNTQTLSWLIKDGVEYEPFYNNVESLVYSDKNGTLYLVEVFSKSGEADGESFYSVMNTVVDVEKCHIFTSSQWSTVDGKILHRQDDDIEDADFEFQGDFSPDSADIKENKKGL
jgi:hypothetical protein